MKLNVSSRTVGNNLARLNLIGDSSECSKGWTLCCFLLEIDSDHDEEDGYVGTNSVFFEEEFGRLFGVGPLSNVWIRASKDGDEQQFDRAVIFQLRLPVSGDDGCAFDWVLDEQTRKVGTLLENLRKRHRELGEANTSTTST